MLWDLYQVYGGKDKYEQIDLDEIAAMTMVWWSKRNGTAELERRRDERLSKAFGGGG